MSAGSRPRAPCGSHFLSCHFLKLVKAVTTSGRSQLSAPLSSLSCNSGPADGSSRYSKSRMMSQPYLPPRPHGVTPAATSLSLACSSSAYDVGTPTFALSNRDLLYQAPTPARKMGTPVLTPSKVMPATAFWL